MVYSAVVSAEFMHITCILCNNVVMHSFVAIHLSDEQTYRFYNCQLIICFRYREDYSNSISPTQKVSLYQCVHTSVYVPVRLTVVLLFLSAECPYLYVYHKLKAKKRFS